MQKESLYDLGKKAQAGDEISLIKIINRKRKMIERLSFGDEDRYQFIILKLIEGIKRYNFEKKL